MYQALVGLGIVIYGGNVEMMESTFMNHSKLNENTDLQSYGTITSINSSLKLLNIDIKYSQCYEGCALYLQNSDLIADGCNFNNNFAKHKAAAIWGYNMSNSLIKNTKIIQNICNGSVGGIFIEYSNNITLNNLQILQNIAIYNNSGILISNSKNIHITDSKLYENSYILIFFLL